MLPGRPWRLQCWPRCARLLPRSAQAGGRPHAPRQMLASRPTAPSWSGALPAGLRPLAAPHPLLRPEKPSAASPRPPGDHAGSMPPARRARSPAVVPHYPGSLLSNGRQKGPVQAGSLLSGVSLAVARKDPGPPASSTLTHVRPIGHGSHACIVFRAQLSFLLRFSGRGRSRATPYSAVQNPCPCPSLPGPPAAFSVDQQHSWIGSALPSRQ